METASSMPSADSTSARTGVEPPSRSAVSVTCSSSSVLASMTPSRPGNPASLGTSSSQNSVERSLIRTRADRSPRESHSMTPARASSLFAVSTASSMSSTIWSARDSEARSNRSVRAPLTSSQERASSGPTLRCLTTPPSSYRVPGHSRPGRVAGSSGGALPEEAAGDDHALDLVGALVDLGDLGVAHHALDREVLGVAGAAEELDGVGGDLHGDVGGEGLGRRGDAGDVGAALLPGGGGDIDQVPGGLDLHLHVGEQELHALERADRRP